MVEKLRKMIKEYNDKEKVDIKVMREAGQNKRHNSPARAGTNYHVSVSIYSIYRNLQARYGNELSKTINHFKIGHRQVVEKAVTK